MPKFNDENFKLGLYQTSGQLPVSHAAATKDTDSRNRRTD
jgi:hypothetical protein